MVNLSRLELFLSKYPCTVVTVAAFDDLRLKKTFESLLYLKAPIEYIVVVPKTDYSSIRLFQEYKQKFQFDSRILYDRGTGVYPAMNLGGSAAKGRFIIYWNAGDLMLKIQDFFEFSEVLKDVSEKWIIFGAKIDWSKKPEITVETPAQFVAQSKNGYLSHQQIAVEKELFLQIGMFDSRYKIAADFKMIAELSKLQPFLATKYRLVEVERPFLSSNSNRRGRFETFIVLCKLSPPNLIAITRILKRELCDFRRFLKTHKFGLSIKIR